MSLINTIVCGDCREILPTLTEKVDLVLTDPPYGIDYQSAWRIGWQRKAKIQGDIEFPLWLFDIIKPRCAFLVFTRWDILPSLPKPKSFIVWDKMVHSMGDLNHEYGRQWEGIAFYPMAEHQFKGRPADIIRCMRVPPPALQHPNEKPISLLTELMVWNVGELVCDPFCGVGSTCTFVIATGAAWLPPDTSLGLHASLLKSLLFGSGSTQTGRSVAVS